MKQKNFAKWTLFLVCVLAIVVALTAISEATSLVGVGFERTLGAGAVADLIKQYGGEYILPVQKRLWVEEIFARLVAVTERDDVEYTLTALNSHEANAFALPGGYIFITKGLLNTIGFDGAKLAAVLGHEIAHVEKKHGVNAVLRQMGLTVLLEVGAMVIDFASADLLRLASATLLQLIQRGWGRDAEYEADLVGQGLSVAAGFDPIGSIRLLDDLGQADPEDLPLKVFRTHPDMIDRRNRLEKNLKLFWTDPVLVTDDELTERLISGRNSDQNGRSDPKGRYVVENLGIFDRQIGQYLAWIEYGQVVDYVWSPQGDYFAVLVRIDDDQELWIYDRHGHPIRQVVPKIVDQVNRVSWSPQGRMLALDVETLEGHKVLVTYVDTEVYIAVSGELIGKNSIWLDDGLYFSHADQWYYTKPPEVRSVLISNPVPQVLERRRILSPTMIKDGNTFRLTRPTLTIPDIIP